MAARETIQSMEKLPSLLIVAADDVVSTVYANGA
jgi:hypothetical protein